MKKIDKYELHSIFSGIKDDNQSDFDKLYEKYKSLVYGVAFSILKNNDDSEEVVQMVFMKIFKLEKEKLPKENEASWLYTFSKNTALNVLRTKKQEVNIDDIYYMTDEDKELNKVIEKDTYNRIISRLNKREQEIVSLKIISNLSFKEISKILDIPTGTVQWKYYKALHTLKILLSSASMYILTIIALIVQKNQKKVRYEEMNEAKQELQATTKPTQETLREDIDEEKKLQIETSKSENEAREDVVVKEDTETNNIQTKQEEYITIEQENNANLNWKDIGLVSVSGIFLIITIIFLVSFMKSQQKSKNKLSK